MMDTTVVVDTWPGLVLGGVGVDYVRGGAAVTVLNDLDLDVSPGRLVALAGRSGSGKSTALDVLYGKQRPSRGSVVWEGVDVWSLSERGRQRIRRDAFGYVGQQVLLFEDLTARANAMLTGASATVVDGLLGRLGLESLVESKAGTLSGGEQQRVTVVRALAPEPRFVLMDEPTASLDRRAAELVASLLVEARDRGAAVIVGTHDDVILEVVDDVVRL